MTTANIESPKEELRILEKAKKLLLPIPGVLGVGLTHSNITNVSLRGYQILVSLETKKVSSMLPKYIEGIPIVYKISKRIKPASTGRYRLMQSGVSIGLLNAPRGETGTLGCFAKDNKENIIIISNNHVISLDIGNSSYKALPGDSIIQPGKADGGTSSDQIGVFGSSVHITDGSTVPNIVDAAYAFPLSSSTIKEPNVCNLYTNETIISIPVGLQSKKAGRTTGCTDGIVEQTNASYYIGYDIYTSTSTATSTATSTTTFSSLFDDLITIINPSTNNIASAQSGDSGSMWVTSCGNNAVGLTFAADEKGAAIVCKASNIEKELGMKFGSILIPECRNPCITTSFS